MYRANASRSPQEALQRILGTMLVLSAILLSGLVLGPLLITVAVGPNATPNNECYAAGERPDAGITLIGRCLQEATR